MAYNFAARFLVGMYKFFGMDMSRLVSDERRFNMWANIWMVGVLLGMIAGIAGLLAGIAGVVVELTR